MTRRLIAFLVRDVRIARSYRAALIGQIVGTLLFVASFAGMVGAVAGGAYAPVATFPRWLARVADLNPVTYALDAWRGALLDGKSPGDIGHPLVVLVAVAVVVAPVAWWALGRAIDVARADGTLSTY